MSYAITNSEKLSTVPLEDKQIIFSQDDQIIYVDLYENGEILRKAYLSNLPGRVAELESVASRLENI